MSDGAWRKIDIDAYDPDRIDPGELVEPFPLGPSEALQAAQERERAVRGHITRGDLAGALSESLRDQPWGDEYEQAKQSSLAAVLLVLAQTPSQQIPTLVKPLSPVEQDTLMKYLYKAMATLSESSAAADNTNPATLGTVLGWHDKLTQVAGPGCIVRVMSDRRRL